MGLLGVGLVFVGYVLCYAATANHGKFATSPWDGVTGDAYDAPSGTGDFSQGIGGGDFPVAPRKRGAQPPAAQDPLRAFNP